MTSRKLSIYVLISLAFIICLLAVLLGGHFLDGEKEYLAKLKFKMYDVEIRFVKSSTSADFIQVSRRIDGGNEKIIKNVRDKNFLFGYYIVNDSTLRLFVNNGGDQYYEKPDTVNVILR